MRNLEIKLIQCEVGRFNLLSNEESLSFSIGIYEDGKILERDGLRARLYYSGDSYEYDEFKGWGDGYFELDFILDKCIRYARRIASSTDYEGEALLFVETYLDNFKDIRETMIMKRRKEIRQRIIELENELKSLDLKDYKYELVDILKDIEKNELKSVEYYQRRRKEFKKKSNGYQETVRWEEIYQKKASKYGAVIGKVK